MDLNTPAETRREEGGISTSKPLLPDVPLYPQVLVKREDDGGGGKREAVETLSCLPTLPADMPLEVLQTGVEAGLKHLDTFKAPLKAAISQTSEDATHWLKQIETLLSMLKRPQTFVGVIGDSGAGKSSLINALLGKEKLLPTSCVGACTASPIEISYNTSDDPDQLYRAEVEFITVDDWDKELKALFASILNKKGEVAGDCRNNTTEAGTAFAKVKAIYPQKTNDIISKSNPHDLANEPRVRGLLGDTKIFKERSAKELYLGLQRYTESKDKTAVDKMEYWPLVKVVRIFTKAEALETGAIIVDLPGVQDSNAARAAMAENYMKKCGALWIVAPIVRAADNATASKPTEKSFRRQMRYDGNLGITTVICSKTDDINDDEVVASLQLEDETDEILQRIQQIDELIDALKDVLAPLEEAETASIKQLDQCNTALRTRSDLTRHYHAGQAENDQKSSLQESGEPLAGEEATPRQLKQEVEEDSLRTQLEHLDNQAAPLREQLRALERERLLLRHEKASICLKARNNYCKKVIRDQFANKVKEFDQENVQPQDDASSIDSDEDLRDYDEVAESLPVFCVSSKAFKLKDRLKKDPGQMYGFLTEYDSEMPALISHMKKVTEPQQILECRRFLNEVQQLFNSLKIWVSSISGVALKEEERVAAGEKLGAKLDELKKEFDRAAEDCIASIRTILQEKIFDAIEQCIPEATAEAEETATRWSSKEGGMKYQTYKATMRRNGVFPEASGGPRDLNADLFEPISERLAAYWERAMQHSIPAVLDSVAPATTAPLQNFHDCAIYGAYERGFNLRGLDMLRHQLQTHTQNIGQIPAALRAIVTDHQRDANRAFTPEIMESMKPAYAICEEESGTGAFQRMKDAILEHIRVIKDSVFNRASGRAKEILDEMCKQVQEKLTSSLRAVCQTIKRDYTSAVVGMGGDRGPPPAHELQLRDDLRAALQKSDQFSAWLSMGGHDDEPDKRKVEEDEDDDVMIIEPPVVDLSQAPMDDTLRVANPDATILDQDCVSIPGASITDNPGSTQPQTVEDGPVDVLMADAQIDDRSVTPTIYGY